MQVKISEPRLLGCSDQHQLLCTLQEEQASCLDAERLLLLCFGKRTFLRAFATCDVHALRQEQLRRLRREAGNASDGTDAGLEDERTSSEEEAVDAGTDFEMVSRDDTHTPIGPPGAL